MYVCVFSLDKYSYKMTNKLSHNHCIAIENVFLSITLLKKNNGISYFDRYLIRLMKMANSKTHSEFLQRQSSI